MHLHNSITFWKQSEPWWCSKLKTRSFAQRCWHTACVWGEKSIWWAGDHYGEPVRRICGRLYVISMEIKQRSTERRILRCDQMQLTTKDQRESKHSLGKNKNWHAISSKITQKRCLPGLVVGFRKAVRICVKQKKITSNHSRASRCDAHQLTMEKATGPHVSKLFWAPLQYAAGIHTGVIHRGLARAVMVNSKRVSRCPWESSWTVTEGLSRISVTLSPWERPLRTTAEVHKKLMPYSQSLNVHLNWPTYESCTGIIHNIRLLEE